MSNQPTATIASAHLDNKRPPAAVVEVRAADLDGNGGIFCPNPKAGMKLWNTHPRIFLQLATASGEGRCPYCGTLYRLAPGEQVGHGH